jgi:hypothetical protein
MAAFILVALILFLVGSNEAIGYYFSHCEDDNLIDCFLSHQEDDEPEEGEVAAVGTYSYKDYPVTITMVIPLGGGQVTGTVSGTCEGHVKGTYNGQPNGSISGMLTGACSPFFVNIPASAEFNGTVNKTGKTVPISFTGRGGGITHQGSMTLTYP